MITRTTKVGTIFVMVRGNQGAALLGTVAPKRLNHDTGTSPICIREFVYARTSRRVPADALRGSDVTAAAKLPAAHGRLLTRAAATRQRAWPSEAAHVSLA